MANPGGTPQNLRPPWPKGVSGNPAGYSRGRRAVDGLLGLIAEGRADRAIAAKWLAKILAGDFRYFKEYLDRRDGRVKDGVAVAGRRVVVARRDRAGGRPRGAPPDAHE